MQLRSVVWIAVVAMGLSCFGCAGSSEKVVSQNQTLLSLNPAKGYIKKVALVKSPVLKTTFERQAGALYFNSLAATIQKEAPKLQLLTSDTAGFPDFMAALPNSKAPVNAEALALAGRKSGFNGLITTAVRDVRPIADKSGMLWFRKPRYRLEFEVTLELFDPITGAKMLNAIEEGSVKISETAFENFKAGDAVSIEPLDEALVEVAEDIGELVAKTLAAQPWQTSVVRVDNGKIHLSAGRQAGLQTGQQLAVVKGRRSIDGYKGEKFIVPGNKIGDIVIKAVSDQMAEAEAVAPIEIKVGDIALPVRR